MPRETVALPVPEQPELPTTNTLDKDLQGSLRRSTYDFTRCPSSQTPRASNCSRQHAHEMPCQCAGTHACISKYLPHMSPQGLTDEGLARHAGLRRSSTRSGSRATGALVLTKQTGSETQERSQRMHKSSSCHVRNQGNMKHHS